VVDEHQEPGPPAVELLVAAKGALFGHAGESLDQPVGLLPVASEMGLAQR